HQWVRMRTRVMNALQGIALAHGMRRGASLWSRSGQAMLASLPLPPHAGDRRTELQGLRDHLTPQTTDLDQRVDARPRRPPPARRLMTHPGRRSVTALAAQRVL